MQLFDNQIDDELRAIMEDARNCVSYIDAHDNDHGDEWARVALRDLVAKLEEMGA